MSKFRAKCLTKLPTWLDLVHHAVRAQSTKCASGHIVAHMRMGVTSATLTVNRYHCMLQGMIVCNNDGANHGGAAVSMSDNEERCSKLAGTSRVAQTYICCAAFLRHGNAWTHQIASNHDEAVMLVL